MRMVCGSCLGGLPDQSSAEVTLLSKFHTALSNIGMGVLWPNSRVWQVMVKPEPGFSSPITNVVLAGDIDKFDHTAAKDDRHATTQPTGWLDLLESVRGGRISVKRETKE